MLSDLKFLADAHPELVHRDKLAPDLRAGDREGDGGPEEGGRVHVIHCGIDESYAILRHFN
jgi:hypothetical protein